MDPPQHTIYRRLISSAFTPRNVRQIEEQIHRNAVSIVDDLVGAGDIDFVAACSARLPMLTIMDMLGVPAADQPAVAKAAEKLFGMSDDEYSTLEERAQDPVNEITLLSNTGVELAKFRRANPGDDLMTSIVNAEVDGHRLTDEEIGAFLILLASAGNDTTKQTTTHAMMALVDNPEQRDWLMEDFENRIGPAVEEFVRWASPVMQFARFATTRHRDQRAAGRCRRQGRPVLLLGQPRRIGLRRSGRVRPDTLTQPASGLRRRRPALLPRQPAGQDGAAEPVPRVADSAEDRRVR